MSDQLLLNAARIIEREAETIRQSSTSRDPTDAAVKADHDEMIEVAQALRVRAKGTSPT